MNNQPKQNKDKFGLIDLNDIELIIIRTKIKH